MDLLVNVTSLQSPLTGIGHYTHNLLRNFIARSDVDDIRGVSALGGQTRAELTALIERLECGCDSGNRSNTGTGSMVHRILGHRGIQFAKQVPGIRRLKQGMEQYRTREFSRACSQHVYWEPNYVLLPFDGPSVTTVHDVSHIHYPQYHPEERVRFLNEQLPGSIERAQSLVVVSEFTRSEVTRYLGVDSNQMSVITPGVSPFFCRSFDEEELIGLRSRYGLPEHYILYVGTLEPRKNLCGLIRAYKELPSALRQQYPLVLVGCKGWGNDQLESELRTLLNKEEVIRLGYVAQSDLPSLYAAATVMTYVSFYEGFGMPIVEAMSAGTAVLTANCASMPEVAGGCAELVDPNDIDCMSNGLRRLLEDDSHRQSLAQAGRLHAQQFTWERSADQLFNLLNKVGEY
ncbi:glycosyltransferase family 1 protein [Motiliproteus sp. MSK22-1]|uniref:glycosyltransferase family 4 protein n=1 Tax=Motiliproteus sp. MSK22-1 TaxID=1897630 RepID=UPI0009785FBA|nr:glycosyltransferase family 1 protein [Motiliproteus sp. MSK22-1]OMH30410.1 hypothetical protein BGP75_18730 [Motiliproteus sp. MSK22-1]